MAVACLRVWPQAQDSISRGLVLDGVTVTGESRRQPSSPLRVIDSEAFLRLGVTDIADALHRLPGITLRDYGGAGGMKTVSVRGLGSRHTGVSYDGIVLSDCQTGEIDVSRYSLENASSISLSVGDNDDIFVPARQAASAALLSITTLAAPTADRRPHVTAQVKLGSFGYASPFIRYSQSLTDRLALTVSGEYVYAENDYPFSLRNGTHTTREKRTNSMMNSAHGEAGAVWTGRNSRIDGKIYYYDNDRRLPGQVRYYTNVSDEQLHDRNFFAQMKFSAWNSRNLSVRLYAKYNWASSAYTNGVYQGGVNDATYWQREAYTSAGVMYTPGGRWAAGYSADYMMNNLNSSLATDTRPYRHTLLHAATVRYRSQRLTATARLLWSLYFNGAKLGPAARDMRRLSPSVSLSYRVPAVPGMDVRLSYKSIFRAPTFNESYFFHYGSTTLLPETTDQVNAGVTWRHTGGRSTMLKLSADAYVNSVADKIVAVPYNMFVWTNVNVGRVRGKGVELDGEWRRSLGRRCMLLVAANYTWQRIENRTSRQSPYYGYQIAYTPEHQGSGAVSVETPWVNVSVHGYGVSLRHSTNNHYEGTAVPGYAEFGLTAYRRWALPAGTVELRGDIKNILDKQYEIVAKYPMPGRSWQLSLNYRF